MKPLTLITHHYNGHDRVITLLDHIASFAEEIRSKLSIIVVDDYSDESQALPQYDLDITQYRVLTDIPWNQCGARNLGVFMSETPWALLFDVDQHPRERGIKYILHHYEQLQPDTMYSFRVSNYLDANDHQALEVHPNTLLVPVTNFKEFGMYDEDFAGNYGYEDLYLPVMWEMRGGKRIVLGPPIPRGPRFIRSGAIPASRSSPREFEITMQRSRCAHHRLTSTTAATAAASGGGKA